MLTGDFKAQGEGVLERLKRDLGSICFSGSEGIEAAFLIRDVDGEKPGITIDYRHSQTLDHYDSPTVLMDFKQGIAEIYPCHSRGGASRDQQPISVPYVHNESLIHMLAVELALTEISERIEAAKGFYIDERFWDHDAIELHTNVLEQVEAATANSTRIYHSSREYMF